MLVLDQYRLRRAHCGYACGGCSHRRETSEVTWRWCFWINLPVGGPIIALVLIFFKVPKHIKPAPATWVEILRQLDLPGFALLLTSLLCLILALQWGGQTKSWSDGSVIATLVMWIVLTIAFFIVEWIQGHYAMVPLALLKPRLVWTNALYGWIANLGNFQVLFYLPIYFQSIHGQSAIASGVNSLPFMAFFAAGSMLSGSSSERHAFSSRTSSSAEFSRPSALRSSILSTPTPPRPDTLGPRSFSALALASGTRYQ
ncbi:hypothetical protein VTK26DRAFT_3231 [Humicola hyalothermophila]